MNQSDMNMEFESPYFPNDGGNENPASMEDEKVAEEEDDCSSTKRQLRKERGTVMQNAATQLEAILNDVKGTAKRLLEEMNIYMEAAESISFDYMQCQESQGKEALRLREVEPDVEGATHRFFQQAQELAMISHLPASHDGATDEMLSSRPK